MTDIEIEEEKVLIATRKAPGDNWVLEIDKTTVIEGLVMALTMYMRKTKFKGHYRLEPLEGKLYIIQTHEVEIPEEAKEKVDTSIFAYGSLVDDFYVLTSTTIIGELKEQDVDKQKALNITSIIEKSLKEWEVQGIQNIITKNEEFKTPNDAQGIKTFGTAEFPTSLKGEYFEGEYMYLSFTTEQVIQQIILVWRTDDPYADDIVKRIVDSVELNENVKREEESE